ncbi:maleylpyruvate isomerase family mycothiol-dependent enzyme [Actinacidiphila acididurans]|uniref:Maleylpyruvate isomerase family mycothiol-dependent enzyme n=1 Tax=Actinacidiphila acididurans TaxID=2784346 RepID=A0ABS2TUR0_9ACTN|nr:maleylpyruvate isomerase family mycothiol-dependent enzyme [Actinacidiphila acididurans]MBM9507073.1 maleylpyruvate isomerase family mycothiol-dependent enzyme [Actinacidiphila acididurans]
MTSSSSAPPAQPAGPGPEFAERLELIEERSAALRLAAGSADPLARVPGCPDWTVRDLVAHMARVQRFWAASVTAGPASRPPADEAGDPPPPGELMAWSARCTQALIEALRLAGPDANCWTWWADWGHPSTAGAVARHQVQEAAVHARDAQEAAGTPEPLPPALAVDAVDQLLHVGFAAMDGWPNSPARVALIADEGVTWTLVLDDTGASAHRGAPGGGPQPGATLSGPAGELLLALYRRIPWDSGALRVSGDVDLVRQLVVWPPLG